MRIPKAPPSFGEAMQRFSESPETISRLRDDDVEAFVRKANDSYLHWEKLRYYPMPQNFDPVQMWAAVQLSRRPQRRYIPLSFTDVDHELKYWTPPKQQEWLHRIDQDAGGMIGARTPFGVQDDDERYLFNSLMEEAIASSQLEGATTTREVAKNILRSKKKPRDRSEQMIVNNYVAIQELRELKHEIMTLELLSYIQGVITENTLDDPSHSGRLRRPGDPDVVVENRLTGDVLHTPPNHHHVEWRVEEICDFANERQKPFIHPVIKAIALHFAIGYVHPFIDGNGRTARALFYWFMLKNGYWLFEYLPISRVFVRAPSRYAKAYLYTEHDGGDLTYFTQYHLDVVIKAMKDLRSYLDKQQAELSRAHRLLGSIPELNHRQAALIRDAIKHPGRIYSVAQHAGKHNVTKATARSDLFGLEEKNLLWKRKDGRQWNFYPVEKIVKELVKQCS